MTKLLAVLSVLGATGVALAQTGGGLGNLAGLGIGGLVLLGILAFVLWRFVFGRDDD
jgi:hypothetical protein